jgi:hypothetical protein
MRVLANSKSGATLLRRHRRARSAPDTAGAQEEQPEPRSAGRDGARHSDSLVTERPLAEAVAGSQTPAARRRRREPAPQDHALYSCECGFVFEADVSTSVGCPHCGGAQAW